MLMSQSERDILLGIFNLDRKDLYKKYTTTPDIPEKIIYETALKTLRGFTRYNNDSWTQQWNNARNVLCDSITKFLETGTDKKSM